MEPTPKPSIWLLPACCFGMMTVSFSPVLNANYLVDLQDAFSLSANESGYLLSCGYIGGLIAALMTGPLADRLGYRVMFLLSALMQMVGLGLLGLALNRTMLYTGATLAGIGCAMAITLIPPVISQSYPQRRARMMNLCFAFNSVGAVVAALLALGLYQWGLSWQVGYPVVLGLTLPYLISFLILPLPPRVNANPNRQRARHLAFAPAFLILCAILFLVGGTEAGISMWAPTYLKQTTDATWQFVSVVIDKNTLGTILFLIFAGAGVGGKLLVSFMAERFDIRYVVGGGALICAAGLTLATVSTWTGLTILAFFLVALGISGFSGTVNATAGDRYPLAGASMFAVLGMAPTCGAATSPALIGALGEISLRLGMGVMIAAPLLSLVLLYVVLPWYDRCPARRTFNLLSRFGVSHEPKF